MRPYVSRRGCDCGYCCCCGFEKAESAVDVAEFGVGMLRWRGEERVRGGWDGMRREEHADW